MKKQNKKPAPVPPVKTNTPADEKKIIFWLGIICAAFAFLLYANTLGHDYTVDDGTVIANNTITKKGISAIPEIFSSSYRAGFWDRKEGLYRPLSVAMFAVEHEIAPGNPFPGHLINVLLYALTALLLFRFLRSIFINYSLIFPLLVTLLFVVHPIHTEVVANIKSRDEILAFLFSVITLHGLYKYLHTKKPVMMIISCIAFFLAYLSKESAIALVGIIPFFIWFFSRETFKSNLLISSVFAGVTALYLMVRYQVLGELTGSAELQLINNSIIGARDVADRFATAMSIMGKYFYLLIIPHPLVFDYSYNQIPVTSFGSPVALFTLAICIAMAWYAFRKMPSKNPASFGILFFFGSIALVSNILFLIESTMAERFLYMPSLGFCILAAWLILHLARMLQPIPADTVLREAGKKKPAVFLMSVILILYAGKTISRNSDWTDNFTLLQKDVKTSPNSARIRYAFGSALLIEKALNEKNPQTKNSFLDRSIAELEKGVSILPNYAEAWYHLGIAYKERNNIPASVNAFEKARSYKEFKNAEFYISSGLAYGLAKNYDAAIADFTKAIDIDPANPEAYNNKGLYFTEKGTLDSAHIYLDKAIQMKPSFYEAYYNKGNTFAKASDFNGAIRQYQKALEIKPGYTDALLNLGNSYAAMNDYNNALKYFRLVEAEEPTNAKVLFNIGITYRFLGDEKNAVLYMDKAKAAGANF